MSSEFDDDDPLANRTRATDLERIKQARKKRISQLKNWQQYDKTIDKTKVRSGKLDQSKSNGRNIHFSQSLVLLEAAGRGDIEEVNQILSDGASPDVCNEDGLTALHQCCIDNNLQICRLLLKYGVNINATDSELWTPLHAAAACAHIDICACLIESGAELLALNAEGNMPYDICEEENTLDLLENAMAVRGISQEDIDERRKVPEVNMLSDLQSDHNDLTKLDEQGATYMHIAAACGYMDVGRYLIDNGVPVGLLDKDGWQPIHVAACWGQLEFIELLLHRGADINGMTTGGETVYDICEDPDMHTKLIALKQEMEKQHEIKKTLQLKPSGSNLNARNSCNKRSASIRRSSMKEKSLTSWKEARQEALIKKAVEKQISIDISNDSYRVSDQKGDTNEAPKNNDEIDISQVLLDVKIVTENEIAQREPFVRRGSSRNSFTHSHPYHSPSRDPSLLEAPVDEELSNEVDTDDTDTAQTFVPVSKVNSSRNGKQPSEVATDTKKPPSNNTSSARGAEPLLPVATSNRTPSSNAGVRPPPKKQIDSKAVIKPNKGQGCCLLM